MHIPLWVLVGLLVAATAVGFVLGTMAKHPRRADALAGNALGHAFGAFL